MLSTTLRRLRCPSRKPDQGGCGGVLKLHDQQAGAWVTADGAPKEVAHGHLKCAGCGKEFPILSGVAVLVDDFYSYLLGHAGAFARLVPDEQIPADYLPDYLAAKEELALEHINEDLESERVVALYFLTHYVRASGNERWWGGGDALIDSLIRQHWDHGPFRRIERWLSDKKIQNASLVELGCGVGGLFSALEKNLAAYLGIDGSFASIALARHLTLGVPYSGSLRVPGDLLDGELSRDVAIQTGAIRDGRADFVVGDLTEAPVQEGVWDLSVALNTIDMLDSPEILPAIQCAELKPGGFAIQSSPYTWHPAIAAELKSRIPPGKNGSAQAVEWLYEEAGFQIDWKEEHVPWLFFKHARQIEIYSTHCLAARKT